MKMLLLLVLFPTLAFAESDFAEVEPLLQKYCYECHGTKKSKGGINLEKSKSKAAIVADFHNWQEAVAQLHAGDMPPAKAAQPSPEEARRLELWIGSVFTEARARGLKDPGPAALRRLNRFEYDNSIRDITGFDFHPAQNFPQEGGGGEGFDNTAAVLHTSPLMLEKLLEAANASSLHLAYLPGPGFTFTAQPHQPLNDSQLLFFLEGELTCLRDAVLPQKLDIQVDFPKYMRAAWQHQRAVEKDPKANSTELAQSLKLNPVFLRKWIQFLNSKPRPAVHDTISAALKPWDDLKPSSSQAEVEAAIAALSNAYSNARNKIDNAPPDEKAIHQKMLHQIGGQLMSLNEEEMKQLFTPQQAAECTSLEQQIPLLKTLSPKSDKAAIAQLSAQLRPQLETLLLRCWRKPVQAAKLAEIEAFFLKQWHQSSSLQHAAQVTFLRILSSPRFFYRLEEQHQGAEAKPLNDFDLAVRLSYFLWSSGPDEELLTLAAKAQLGQESILRQQVARMLKDPRSRALADSFAAQWLRFREISQTHQLSLQRFPEFTPELRALFYEENAGLFHQFIQQNLPVAELFDSRTSWLNASLAKHYGLPPLQGEHFRLVLSEDPHGGGLLSTGAFAAITSYPLRTSPVLRGNLILSQILGTPTPPPPPDAGKLPEDDQLGDGLSIRQRLEKHRANPTCANCHNRIDPLGFPLEGLDPLGRPRTIAAGAPVETSSELANGERLSSLADLKKHLRSQQVLIARNLATKMLGYALGRELEFYDQVTLDQLDEQLKKDEYRLQSLITGIVLSYPFRHRRAKEPDGVAK